MHLLRASLFLLSASFTLLALPAQGAEAVSSLPLSGWGVVGDRAGKWTPTEAEGRVVFSAEGFGEKGKFPAASFPKTELRDGQKLELSAKVAFKGVSGTGNFRFGIFLKRSKDHARGWLGYCAIAGLEKSLPTGGLYARLPGNESTFDSLQDEKPETSPRLLAQASGSIQNIRNETYRLTMVLIRTGKDIACTARLVSVVEGAYPAVEYSALDQQPGTYVFDTLGFNSRQVLSADVLEFSEVSVTIAPVK